MIRSLILLITIFLAFGCHQLEPEKKIVEQSSPPLPPSTYSVFPTSILLKEKTLRLLTEKYSILSAIPTDSLFLSSVDTPVTGTDGKFFLLPVKKGEQYNIQFPVASRAFVNAGTRFLMNLMPFMHNFILQGKAWFKTENDTTIVYTDDLTITIFPHSKVNIDNYPDEPNSIISLMEGGVVVSRNNRHTPLLPHEEFWFNKAKKSTQIKKITVDVASWTLGTFRRWAVDFKYQMREIGRLYNKTVYLDPAIKNGIFPRLNFDYRKTTIEQVVNGYNSEPMFVKLTLSGDSLNVMSVKSYKTRVSQKGANISNPQE